MRWWSLAVLAAGSAGPATAQQLSSATAQVTLVARKAASVSVLPAGASALTLGLAPEPEAAAAAPALDTSWNLPITLVGELTWRTTGRRGAPYIERRVALLDPIARTRQPLDAVPSPGEVDASRVVVVRLVVY
jgi:hypothetical protein